MEWLFSYINLQRQLTLTQWLGTWKQDNLKYGDNGIIFSEFDNEIMVTGNVTIGSTTYPLSNSECVIKKFSKDTKKFMYSWTACEQGQFQFICELSSINKISCNFTGSSTPIIFSRK